MLQESLYLDEGDGYTEEAPPPPYPSRAPPPQPPALAKYHIYNDPLEFADMDQIAISVRPHRGILLAAGFLSRVILLVTGRLCAVRSIASILRALSFFAS